MTIKPKIYFRLRAAAVMLALALGWISTPLSLAVWQPDVCEMECCIAEGHCCCATRHAYVKGHEPKPGEVTLNNVTTLGAPCPASCTGSTVTAKNHLPRVAHSALLYVTPGAATLPHSWDQILPARFSAAQLSSPRAPPLSSGFAA